MERILKNDEIFYLYSVKENEFSQKCKSAVNDLKKFLSVNENDKKYN